MSSPIVTDPLAHAELRKTLEVILADVDSWDQSFWGALVRPSSVTTLLARVRAEPEPACRTAFCVAGHYAVTVAGYRPVWGIDAGEIIMLDYVTRLPEHVEVPPEKRLSVESVARDAFGLTLTQGTLLFHQSNSLRRVLDLAYLYTGGAVDLFATYEDVLARHPTLGERELAAERDALQVQLVRYREALTLSGGHVDLAIHHLTDGRYPALGR